MGAIGYLPENGYVRQGEVLLKGRLITGLGRDQMTRVWGRSIGVVYQNPLTALNPSMVIGRQLAEAARAHAPMSRAQALERARDMLTRVAMPRPEAVAGLYPHQLSGGMLQRCVIAMALINSPELLIMDEPTTALDVTSQAVVLDLVSELRETLDASIVYITHDLAVVARICQRIGVLYAGELMEVGNVRDLFHRPSHPYTLSLLGCVPHFDPGAGRRALDAIPGRIPRMDELPEGCVFEPRCRFSLPECRLERPALAETGEGHLSACLRHRYVSGRARDPREMTLYPQPNPESAREVLSVKTLSKHYPAGGSFFSSGDRRVVKAVNGVSLEVKTGFTLGIVGESGCGKTTLIRTIMGLLSPTSGEIRLDGETLEARVENRSAATLGRLQMVFQNPDASLNPSHTIARSIQRPMVRLGTLDPEQVIARTFELLNAVNLPAAYYNRMPAELSGGEKQRVAIARAFAADPGVVLLDEPLSALDVSVQASLINLLFELQARNTTTYLFISHDLATVQHLSDWIAVMYLGRIMETGRSPDVFSPPYHPYTEALLSAIPVADPDVRQQNIRLAGSVPSAMEIPDGCPFHTRCPRCLGTPCESGTPPWREGDGGHGIWCHIPLDELMRVQAAAFVRPREAREEVVP
jgi:peptide/nickel transport system ATP-binding protein